MNLFDLFLLPPNVRVIKRWGLLDDIVLPYTVKTASGKSVKRIQCVVDIYYSIRNDRIKIVKVRLASSIVSNFRSGESWTASAGLRRLLKRLLPKQIDVLVAKNKNLQRIMWGKAADIVPATTKQKEYAKDLGIPFIDRMGKGRQALGKLIDKAKAKKNRSRNKSIFQRVFRLKDIKSQWKKLFKLK
jgi:hypothetical protein